MAATVGCGGRQGRQSPPCAHGGTGRPQMLWLDNHRAFPRAAPPTPPSFCVQDLLSRDTGGRPQERPGGLRSTGILTFKNHSVGASGHSDSHFLFQSIMRRSSDTVRKAGTALPGWVIGSGPWLKGKEMKGIITAAHIRGRVCQAVVKLHCGCNIMEFSPRC